MVICPRPISRPAPPVDPLTAAPSPSSFKRPARFVTMSSSYTQSSRWPRYTTRRGSPSCPTPGLPPPSPPPAATPLPRPAGCGAVALLSIWIGAAGNSVRYWIFWPLLSPRLRERRRPSPSRATDPPHRRPEDRARRTTRPPSRSTRTATREATDAKVTGPPHRRPPLPSLRPLVRCPTRCHCKYFSSWKCSSWRWLTIHSLPDVYSLRD